MIDWQPIGTAPENETVLVYWRDEQDDEPNFAFEQKEDGVWLDHNSQYEAYLTTALPPGSIGPHENAPYTHWAKLQAPSNG